MGTVVELLRTQKDKRRFLVHLPSQPLRRLRKTGLSARVVFLDSSSPNLALASTSKPRSWPISSEEPSGLAHYRSLHDSILPPLILWKHAHSDSSVELYEYQLAIQKSKFRKGKAICWWGWLHACHPKWCLRIGRRRQCGEQTVPTIRRDHEKQKFEEKEKEGF